MGLGSDPPGLWAHALAGRSARLQRFAAGLLAGLKDEAESQLGSAVREPVESVGNAVGCYGLLILMAGVVAMLVTFGLIAPEKNELNIEITALR